MCSGPGVAHSIQSLWSPDAQSHDELAEGGGREEEVKEEEEGEGRR